MAATSARIEARQDCADAHVGSPVASNRSRHSRISNETAADKAARCRAVAQRQASQGNKAKAYEPGHPIGPHTFHSHVGDNPTGLYINLQCKCGNVFPYKRSNLSALTNPGKNVRSCMKCYVAKRKVAKS